MPSRGTFQNRTSDYMEFTLFSAYYPMYCVSFCLATCPGQSTWGETRLSTTYLRRTRSGCYGNLIDTPLQCISGEFVHFLSSVSFLYPALVLTYQRYLVNNASKESPSASQYLRIVQRLESYVSGHVDSFEQAMSLDNVRTRRNSTIETISEGKHWFLKGSITRTQTVWTFCQGLRMRFEKLGPHEMDMPLQRPLGYVGYMMRPVNRFKDHANEDTSWLHHLVLNAFRLEYGDSAYTYESQYSSGCCHA